MATEKRTPESASPPDERAIAKKYGIRELTWPDSEQIRALSAFLAAAIESGRCGVVPRTAVVVIADFLQAAINRQHITKGPRMSAEEFDALQAPYYLAARIVGRIQRTREENPRGRVYQTTWVSLGQFVELLRNLLDPACPWLRARSIPAGPRESMEALAEFLETYPEQRRKTRET